MDELGDLLEPLMGASMLRKALSVACALAIIVLACRSAGPPTLVPSLAATPRLTDLWSPNELKALFNMDAGKVRLVLLISPT